VIECGDGHRLAAEAFARVRVRRHRGRQQLDRDLTIETGIAGAVDHAHSALADAAKDFVRADAGAWSEDHETSEKRRGTTA
jgi:hypothetical protein